MICQMRLVQYIRFVCQQARNFSMRYDGIELDVLDKEYDPEQTIPAFRCNPIELFRHYYGDRVSVKDGAYYLDTTPCKLADIYMYVNLHRVSQGKTPIDVPEKYKI